MNIDRREFMMCGAAFACTGCADSAALAGARPNLRVGVLSDIHVTKPDNATWFEKAAFAGFDSGGTRLLHYVVLAPSAVWIFRRRELDYPVFEPFWQPTVSGKKLACLAIPAHDGLRLPAAG